MKASLYLSKLRQLTYNQVLDNDGFAEKSADSVYNYFQSDVFLKLINDFAKLEEMDKGLEVKQNISLGGEDLGTVCITGTFSSPRPEIAKILEIKGYKIVNTVSSNLSYLICGEKAGSKLSKAEKLGIKIVYDYQQLL
jgi:DNA ligase (NAD+)